MGSDGIVENDLGSVGVLTLTLQWPHFPGCYNDIKEWALAALRAHWPGLHICNSDKLTSWSTDEVIED